MKNPFRRAAAPRCTRCGAHLQATDSLVTADGIVCPSCYTRVGIEEREVDNARNEIWDASTGTLSIGFLSLAVFCDPVVLPILTIARAVHSLRLLRGEQARDLLGARYRLAWVLTLVGLSVGVARPLALFVHLLLR